MCTINDRNQQLSFRKNFDTYSKSIILIRDPLDASIAEFNRLYCWDLVKDKDFRNYAPIEAYEKYNISEFVKYMTNNWISLHQQILERCSREKCHIVFYEDMQRNVIEAMRGVLSFIGFEMIPKIEACIKSNMVGNFKRKSRPVLEKKAIYQMFSKEDLEYFENVYVSHKKSLKLVMNDS